MTQAVFRRAAFAIAFSTLALFASEKTFAQATVPVFAIEKASGTSGYYVGAGDGFVSLYSDGALTESWQLSTIPIRIIAAHPDGNRVAIYESDGFSVYRVSVWDWKAKTRLFAKRFRDSVTSLSWSAKGRWLLVGNTSVEGISILDSARGTPERVFASPPGIVSLALTGPSESSMITFGPSGTILYTDTSSGKERARYVAERDLSRPTLLANNVRIAGYADGTMFDIDATTGKTVKTYSATDPVMATRNSDGEPVWLERGASSRWVLRKGNAASEPLALPQDSSISAALGIDGMIVIGTSSGELYSARTSASNPASVTLTPLASRPRSRVDDIASDGTTLFLLSKGSVYSCESPVDDPARLFDGISGNRLASVDSSLVFWSDRGPGEVIFSSIDGNGMRALYKAKETVHSLSSLGTRISFVEGSSAIRVIDAADPTMQFSFFGVGFQDAPLVTAERLVVSKTSTPRSPYPIIVINVATGETVPLPFAGDLCYGLRLADPERKTLSGFLVANETGSKTDLVTISVNLNAVPSSAIVTELSFADEDLTANAISHGAYVFTNLGKGPLVSVQSKTGRGDSFDRVAALPIRAAVTGRYVVTLNSDGTIAWYERSGGKPIALRSIDQ